MSKGAPWALAATLAASAVLSARDPVSAQAPLPRATPEEVGLDPGALARVTEVVEDAVSSGRIAGAVVGIAKDGRIAYLESAGLQDLESRTPMSERSIFRVYSMTKSVTAVAAMILHEEGRFDLDDPVAAYLPELGRVSVLDGAGGTRPPARPVTVRDLFLHTAGISHRNAAEYREAGVRSRSIGLPEFVDNVVAVPLREDPGTRFRYGAAPTVLGRLIEIWSGQALDAFMDERVHAPLGMRDTGFQVPPEDRDRLAAVYASEPGQPLRPYRIEEVPFTERPALLEGSVGLVSTVPDFLRFAQMLLDGGTLAGVRVLREPTVRAMTVNGLPEEILATRRGGSGWGLANVTVVVDAAGAEEGARVGEYRWDGSAGTEFWVDPASRTIVVTAWQSAPANPDRLRQRIRALVRQAIRR